VTRESPPANPQDAHALARRLEAVLDTMAEGLFTVDPHGRITGWNRAMERLTGYAEEEALGQHCGLLGCDFCEGEPGERGPEHCALFQQGHVDGVDCHIRRKEGSMVPVRKNARVLTEGGQVIGAVETLTDQCALKQAQSQAAEARSRLAHRYGLENIVGKSHAMQELFDLVDLAAASDASVLVTGETGTGKELVASAIHSRSERQDGPFVKVNCSALNESLLESELFGHVKGAFTGAYRDKMGRFEAANGGTLFLDEVGDLSPLIQLKLLRVLQEHEFERVGEATPRRVDVRVIAATHRDLRARMHDGEFRQDLYYRLKVFTIHVPPLRERSEDISLLVEHFIGRFREETGKAITGLDPDAARALMDYCWPGNVRELENAVEHAFVTCPGGTIGLFDLPVDIRKAELRSEVCPDEVSESPPRGTTTASPPAGAGKRGTTREELLALLEACDGNKAEVARRLGVNRSTVWRRMKRLGLLA
jgi:PAS domain S-box-containing protein